MCFYNEGDYDWVAEDSSVEYIRDAECVCSCCECGRQILTGEWRVSISMWEHSCCQLCDDELSEDFDETIDKATCEHEYGETWDGSICVECAKMRAAIYEVEAIEGCPEYARQPNYGDMYDELECRDEHETRKYLDHAIKQFPELATHSLYQKLDAAAVPE